MANAGSPVKRSKVLEYQTARVVLKLKIELRNASALRNREAEARARSHKNEHGVDQANNDSSVAA
jgi:hypothetical protein